MKKRSLKLAIIVPSLAILIVGVAAMIAIAGTLSSNATGELTEELLQARVSENANEFKVFNEKAQGILNTITPIVMQHRAQAAAGTEENVREEVVSILTDVLLASDIIVGAWSVWEPNAFDGRDSESQVPSFTTTRDASFPMSLRMGIMLLWKLWLAMMTRLMAISTWVFVTPAEPMPQTHIYIM